MPVMQSGVPFGADRRTKSGLNFEINRSIGPISAPALILAPGARVGQRIRFMRRSLGYTLEQFAARAAVCRKRLSRLERGRSPKGKDPVLLGRVLPLLKPKFHEAFPETNGEPFDFIYPPDTFGGWLRNLRARKALGLKEMASMLGVAPFTIIRYEGELSKPDPLIAARLRHRFGFNGRVSRWLRRRETKRRFLPLETAEPTPDGVDGELGP